MKLKTDFYFLRLHIWEFNIPTIYRFVVELQIFFFLHYLTSESEDQVASLRRECATHA